MSSSRTKTASRVITGILIFLLVAAAASAVLIHPYDAQFKDNHYDCLLVGGSHVKYGVDPFVFDRGAGTNSANYGIANGPTCEARLSMLRSALKNNDAKTVVLEIAYDVPARDPSNWDETYEAAAVAQFGDWKTRIDYMKHDPTFIRNGVASLYAVLTQSGVDVWKNRIRGREGEFRETKGRLVYTATKVQDMHLSDHDAAALKDSTPIPTAVRPDNDRLIRQMISEAKESGARVVLLVTPMTENMVWTHVGWDSFYELMKGYAADTGCELYDYNLLRDRGRYFSDEGSFFDEVHLNEAGSEAFSRKLGEDLKRATDGKDISGQFYKSYTEAKEHSRYVKQ